MLTAILRTVTIRVPERKRELWLGTAILAAIAILCLLAAALVSSVTAQSAGSLPARIESPPIGEAAPPVPEPLVFKPIAPDEALVHNNSIPLSDLPNPPARSFTIDFFTVDAQRSIECLTAAIYYEAATESMDGQRAVAQVVLNRVRHPAFPKSVCGVVFQGSDRSTGCQFTFACDGSLSRAPIAEAWSRAQTVALAALGGSVYAPVGWATHYHTNWVVPYWSSSLLKLANVGTHIFFRWTGAWGQAQAFSGRYSGAEPVIAKMGGIGDEVIPADPLGAEGQGPVESAGLVDDPARTYEPVALSRAIIRRFRPSLPPNAAPVTESADDGKGSSGTPAGISPEQTDKPVESTLEAGR